MNSTTLRKGQGRFLRIQFSGVQVPNIIRLYFARLEYFKCYLLNFNKYKEIDFTTFTKQLPPLPCQMLSIRNVSKDGGEMYIVYRKPTLLREYLSFLLCYFNNITKVNTVHKLNTRVVFQGVISNVKLTVASFSMIARWVTSHYHLHVSKCPKHF